MVTTLSSIFFRPLPIMTLTVRQFLGGKAVRVVGAIGLIPALFCLIYAIQPNSWPYEQLTDVIFLNLFSPTILPVAALILATSAIGNELEDRTLPYLTLKPIPRLRIVLEKLAGVLVIGIPVILFGLLVSYVIAVQAEGPDRLIGRLEAPDPAPWLLAALVSGTAGVITFGALFLMVSLYIPRALLVGIIYAFVWESLLGRFLPGIRVISVRQYVQSLFVGILDDPNVTIDSAFTVQTSLIVMAVTCIISIFMATRRLRRINLE